MAKKPTYEELEQGVEELEKAVNERTSFDRHLKLLSLAVDQSSEGIAVSGLDGNLEYLNNAFAEMHGYSPEEIIGKNLSIFHTPDQMPSVEAANLELKQTGFFKGEIWHVKSDGTVFPTMMHNSLIRDETNKPIGMMGSLRDISDIKQSEEALLESEDKYRSLVEDSIDGIAIVQGPEMKFANSALIKMFGYKNENEMLGHKFTEFLSPEHHNLMMKMGAEREKGKHVSGRYEFKGLRKDGTKFDAELSVSLINYQGSAARQGVVRDISKEKKAEKALKESEENFRSLAENANDGILIGVGEGELAFANRRAAEITGYSVSELLKSNIKDLAHPNDFKRINERYKTILAGESFPRLYETKIVRKDGQQVSIELASAKSIWHGQPADIVVIRDIADRKQTEEALSESEKRYRAVVESQTEMICRFFPDGTLTFVNEAYCRYFDKGREELIGHKFILLIPESDRDKVIENIASLNPNTPVITIEHRVFAPNGEICWHKWTNRAIFDDKSNLVEYQAVGWDITNRVRVEKALSKAHDELENKIRERTAELEKSKGKLIREIKEHKKTEKILRNREKELENKTNDLEELNAALKVLLDKREEDKIELQDNILSNVKILIEPYMNKLKRSSLQQNQKTLINILESNLNEIVSPFTRKLSSKLLNLSSSEIQVANHVKYGKTNKEIAEMLHVAKRTIAFHRENIRKKLGIKNQKTNLKTYLMSLD